MGKQITVGHLIALVIGILIPLMIWGINVQVSLREHKVDIDSNKEDIRGLENSYEKLEDLIIDNHDKTIDAIHSLDLKLKDKANRK